MAEGESSLGFSPEPVMSFQIGADWFAVPVEQIDRVAVAPRLWPLPFAEPLHCGFFDTGEELIPVMRLSAKRPVQEREQMLAVLHIRGESVGIAINTPGRVYEHYWIDDSFGTPNVANHGPSRRAQAQDTQFWLLNADRLFSGSFT